MKKYKKIKQLSDGHFSSVFLVSDSKNKKFVLKEYKPAGIDQAYLEYLYLNSINIPNVVKAVEFERTDETAYLVLEYIAGKQAEKKTFDKFSSSDLKKFFYELALTIAKVQSTGICINDIKPENVIVKDKKPYIIDLGLATLNGYSDNFMRGTPAYSAPEKIERFTNHFAGEVFSLGILWFYIVNGKTPADDHSFDEYITLIKDQGRFEEYLKNNDTDEFMIKMLSVDPVERPSVFEIADHFLPVNKNADTDLIIMQIKNYVFPAQIESVRNVLRSKSGKTVKYNYQDEIDKIIRIFALWTESEGKRLIVLDEEVFREDPDRFINEISFSSGRDIKNKNDLLKVLNKDNGNYRFLILKKSGGSESFNELYSSVNEKECFVFVESLETDLTGVSKQEYQEFSIKLNLKKQNISEIPMSPYLARLSLLKTVTGDKEKTERNDLSILLQYIQTAVSYNILENVFGKELKELLNKGILENEITLAGNRIISKIPRDDRAIPDRKIISKLKISAEKYGDHLTLGKIAEAEGKKYKEIIEHYKKYIYALSKEEHYYTAFRFMQNLLSEDNAPVDNELKKKYAFLSRMAGEYDISIQTYNELEEKLNEYEKAVISTDKAVVYQDQQNYAEALECYESAIPVFEKFEKIKDILRTMNNKGSVLFEMNEYREAEKVFNLLLHKAQKNSKAQFITMSFLNLAAVSISLGDWKKALHFSKKSLELSEKYNKLRLIIISLKYSLTANAGLGNFDAVRSIYERILSNEAVKENKNLYSELLFDMLYLSNFTGIDKKSIQHLISEIEPVKYEILSDESLKILFFENFNNGVLKKALEDKKYIKDEADKDIIESVIEGNTELILQKLDRLSATGSNYDMIFYSSQLLLNPILSKKKEIEDEIRTLSEIISFAPLDALIEHNNKEKIISVSEGQEVWNILSFIHSSLDFNRTLEAVLRSMIQISDLERAVFFKFEEGKYIPVTALDQKLNTVDTRSLKISTTILKDTVKYGDIRFLTGLQDEAGFDIHSSIFGLGLRSAICSPLLINGSLKGVFYADAQLDRKLSDDEKKKIETILIQAESALKNSDEFEQVKKKAVVFSGERAGKEEIIGNSRQIKEIFNIISTAGRHNVNILITGPTGSGKELIARSLHRTYGRDKPMVSLNCTAIPETLIESELFGYVKGAFTGAYKDKKGLIEAAGEGTLFLDEIGDMPMFLQAKLLRVLQERTYSPVGSSKEKKMSARIITATNKDLHEMVLNGQFREDLLYRLNVVKIDVPPLKERKDDILLLTENFVKKYSMKYNKKIKSITPKALESLKSQEWPGNIRQLENVIEKAVLFAEGNEIHPGLLEIEDDATSVYLFDHIPDNWSDHKYFKTKLMNDLDSRFAKKLLAKFNGNIKKTCEEAGMNRRQIYRILENDKKDT